MIPTSLLLLNMLNDYSMISIQLKFYTINTSHRALLFLYLASCLLCDAQSYRTAIPKGDSARAFQTSTNVSTLRLMFAHNWPFRPKIQCLVQAENGTQNGRQCKKTVKSPVFCKESLINLGWHGNQTQGLQNARWVHIHLRLYSATPTDGKWHCKRRCAPAWSEAWRYTLSSSIVSRCQHVQWVTLLDLS